MARAPYAFALITVGVAFAASCRAPTEISLVLSTDIPCADLRGTSVTVGRASEIEAKAPTTTSTQCTSGDLGTLIVVPSGATTDDVAFKVLAGRKRDVETCTPPYGQGCVVARRTLHFVAHSDLRIEVPLRAACDGVPCGATETCVGGACVAATIGDPGACASGAGCGEGSLGGPGGPGDGGVPDGAPADGAPADAPPPFDAGPGVAGYHDVTDPANWTAIGLSSVSLQWSGFEGAVFDAQYLYAIPHHSRAYSGYVGRYDTHAAFSDTASYSLFNVGGIDTRAVEFSGAAYDGRYFYMAPGNVQQPHGFATRFDTHAAFTDPASWAIFDVSTLSASAVSYAGAVTDGRYIYLVPDGVGGSAPALVARFDPQASFTTGGSWTTFDTTTLGPKATGYVGATFDGRYLYFTPFYGPTGYGGTVSRYDTQAPFGAKSSWSTFDATTLSAQAAGYSGAVFDGRYVYFVPNQSPLALRYDTQATFGAAASWSTFDVTGFTPASFPFIAPGYDGRFVYYVSEGEVVARYDTTAPFDQKSSWSTFGISQVASNTGLLRFAAAGFDGRYMYILPGFDGSTIARFDARYPPALPPTFRGSFY